MCLSRIRIIYLSSFCALLLMLFNLPGNLQAEAKRPNILWIIAEDMSPDLGCYGNAVVATPNVDALAAKGMKFSRVFTTAPACSPSRTALATGVFQTTLGAHHMRYSESLKPSLPAPMKVLPELMREQGYYTGNIRRVAGTGTGKDDWQFKFEGRGWDTSDWDDLISHQPFYAQINSSQSHRGFKSPVGIDKEKIALPPYYPDHPVARDDWAGYFQSVQAFDKQVGAILQLLDAKGLSEHTIVCILSDHGRPMVRGKNWLYDSGIHIPLVMYYPSGVKAPFGYQKGQTGQTLLSSIDLVAQTLSMAGGTVPGWMQGRSFLEKNVKPRKYVFSAADRFGDVDMKSRAIRSERFKYIRNDRTARSINDATTAYRRSKHPIYHLLNIMGAKDLLSPVQAQLLKPLAAEELYDLKNDPYETKNLIDDPALKSTRNELKSRLTQWLAESQDQGLLEDSEALVSHFQAYGVSTFKKRKTQIEKMRQKVAAHFE